MESMTKTKLQFLFSRTFYLFSFVLFMTLFGTRLNAQFGLDILNPEFKACVLRAPDIDLSKYETIAIINFENDNSKSRTASLGRRLAGALQEALTAEYFGAVEEKIYMKKVPTKIFTLVERDEIDRIIEELGFSVSGLVDEASNIAEAGKLAGANVLITGRAGYSTETKTSYNDDGEKKVERIVTLSASMKVLDVETGKVINNFEEQVEETSSDRFLGIQIGADGFSELLNEAVVHMGRKMCRHINPYYELTTFELFDLKKDNKELGKEGHEYLQRGLTEEAFCCYNKVFQEDTYNWRAVFNLGTIHEAVGDYEMAAKFYSLAYQLKDNKGRIRDAAKRADRFDKIVRTLAELGIKITPKKLDDSACTGETSNIGVIDVGRNKYAKVFKAPTKGGDTVTKLPDGMKVTWVAEEGNFIKIKLGFPHEGKMGYIEKDKIEVR